MSFQAFIARMAELDAMVDACRNEPPFSTSIVRDTSNRTTRDWPWWEIQLEHTQIDGSESRRAYASISLQSTREMAPGRYKARWRARIWTGASTDTFNQQKEIELDWTDVTADLLKRTMMSLLSEADAVIDQVLADRRPH